MRLAQCANRRPALGRIDKHFIPAGSALLEPRQQPIVGGQLIDAVTTRRAVAEMGGDVGELRIGELAQGQRTQRFVTWVVQLGLGHDKPV
jgi:hypothetical protein